MFNFINNIKQCSNLILTVNNQRNFINYNALQKPLLVQFKKTVIKSNFMKFPANAISVGKFGPHKGKIIAACGMFNKIQVMDPDSGVVVRDYTLPDYPVKGCDDVTEGPDGALYWTNAGFGTIGYLMPDGRTGEIEGIGWVNSIAVTDDKKWLYYGACIGRDELYRVELGEDGLPKDGVKGELVQAQPGWSNSMDPSSDGFIYAPTNMYGQIRRINPETKDIEVIWEGLQFPSACEINDKTGIIYATEFHLGNITRIDVKNNYSRVLAKFQPFTDNVCVTDDSIHPRIFGSSFVSDVIMELSETGDDPRIISEGGLLFESIECIGDRIYLKDMGRILEYNPKSKKFESFAWGNFWHYADGKSHDWGPQRYDPEKINWTKSVADFCNIAFGKIGRATPDGKKMIAAGEMAEMMPNRLSIIDLETREVSRDIYDLPHLEDVVQVGDDLYLIAQNIPERLRGPEKLGPHSTFLANPEPSMEGMDGDEWQILRIDKNDNRSSIFKSDGLTAFAQKDGNVYATENKKGIIYQMAKDDKWLDSPVEIASGLKGPEGLCVGNDGKLLVLESNEEDNGGHNGRLVAVDVNNGNSEVLFEGLGISKKINPEMFLTLLPHATIGQTDDGTIYLFENGYMFFTMLEPQT